MQTLWLDRYSLLLGVNITKSKKEAMKNKWWMQRPKVLSSCFDLPTLTNWWCPQTGLQKMVLTLDFILATAQFGSSLWRNCTQIRDWYKGYPMLNCWVGKVRTDSLMDKEFGQTPADRERQGGLSVLQPMGLKSLTQLANELQQDWFISTLSKSFSLLPHK